VRGTALPRIKGNFFTANLDAVRAAFESVPWVRRAAVCGASGPTSWW
jgi:cell division protein FtsQ